MAKLHHVKRARKAIPEAGIEVGDSYYFYKRRINGKGAPRVCSKTKPRRSAYMTSSPFLKVLMDFEDDLQAMVANGTQPEVVTAWLDNAASEIEVMENDCRDKSLSVEQGMKNGAGNASAELLLSRAEHCSDLLCAIREAANELELGGESLLENEEGDEDGGEGGVDGPSVAEVVGNIKWLPS